MCLSLPAKQLECRRRPGSDCGRNNPVLFFDATRQVLQQTHRLLTADLSQVCDGRTWLSFRDAAGQREHLHGVTAVEACKSATDDTSKSSAASCDVPDRLRPPQKENQEPCPPSEGAPFATAETAAPQARGAAPTARGSLPRKSYSAFVLCHTAEHEHSVSKGNSRGKQAHGSSLNEEHPSRQRARVRKLSTPMHRFASNLSVPGILQRGGSALELPTADAGWVAAGVAFSKYMEVYQFET